MDLVVGGTTTEHIGHGRDGWLAVEDDREIGRAHV